MLSPTPPAYATYCELCGAQARTSWRLIERWPATCYERVCRSCQAASAASFTPAAAIDEARRIIRACQKVVTR